MLLSNCSNFLIIIFSRFSRFDLIQIFKPLLRLYKQSELSVNFLRHFKSQDTAIIYKVIFMFLDDQFAILHLIYRLLEWCREGRGDEVLGELLYRHSFPLIPPNRPNLTKSQTQNSPLQLPTYDKRKSADYHTTTWQGHFPWADLRVGELEFKSFVKVTVFWGVLCNNPTDVLVLWV